MEMITFLKGFDIASLPVGKEIATEETTVQDNTIYEVLVKGFGDYFETFNIAFFSKADAEQYIHNYILRNSDEYTADFFKVNTITLEGVTENTKEIYMVYSYDMYERSYFLSYEEAEAYREKWCVDLPVEVIRI